MAKLSIESNLKSVVIVGEFCDWDVKKAMRVDLKPKNKLIVINDMPHGLYKVLDTPQFVFGEERMPNGEPVPNRYFSGNGDEKITCCF